MASSLLWFPGEASSNDNFPAPPAVYVDKGACPGECCVFRRWRVLKDATLLDKPNGTRVVAALKKGEWVKVRTKKGVEGWFKELSGSGQSYDDPHFGNRDSCG